MRALLAAAVLLVAGEARGDEPATLGFGERTRLLGRFGLRYQGHLSAADDDHRARIDARVGLALRAVHWAYAVVRVRAAGDGGDPRDGWLELGDDLEAASVALDRAHLRVETDELPELSLSLGLVDHPVAAVSPMSWDRDLAPAGVAASYDRRLRSIPMALRPAAFAYLVRPDGDEPAAGMFGAQLQTTGFFGLVDVAIAGTITGFRDAEPLAILNDTDRFLLVEGDAAVQLHLLYWLPLELFGTAIANARRDSGERFAWSAGLTAGRRDWVGDFEITYRYRDVDRDAVPGALPADDYELRTDVRGHDLIASYQIAEKVRAQTSAFVFRAKDPGSDYATVLRVDLVMEL